MFFVLLILTVGYVNIIFLVQFTFGTVLILLSESGYTYPGNSMS